ncbi:MAG: hypothetical protein HZB67_01935 [Candidatus Aenigmarchaeota archaeon]|nr:hypothetical protein [Candidatus Aenigmarchaeota archaeon]
MLKSKKPEMKKAQVSIELMLYIGIMLVVFAIAIIAAGNRQEEIYRERLATDAKSTLKEVATEIDIAVEVGSGYSHIFTMPDKILGSNDYSVNINKQYQIIYIEWTDKNYSLSMISSNINGSVSKGANRISNIGGLVIIERSDALS